MCGHGNRARKANLLVELGIGKVERLEHCLVCGVWVLGRGGGWEGWEGVSVEFHLASVVAHLSIRPPALAPL